MRELLDLLRVGGWVEKRSHGLELRRLHEVMIESRLAYAQAIRRSAVARKRHDGRAARKRMRAEQSDDLVAVYVRQAEVEENEVRPKHVDAIERGLAIGSDVNVVSQHANQSAEAHRGRLMIVHDEDATWRRRR
jgi:hypothetical protein